MTPLSPWQPGGVAAQLYHFLVLFLRRFRNGFNDSRMISVLPNAVVPAEEDPKYWKKLAKKLEQDAKMLQQALQRTEQEANEARQREEKAKQEAERKDQEAKEARQTAEKAKQVAEQLRNRLRELDTAFNRQLAEINLSAEQRSRIPETSLETSSNR